MIHAHHAVHAHNSHAHSVQVHVRHASSRDIKKPEHVQSQRKAHHSKNVKYRIDQQSTLDAQRINVSKFSIKLESISARRSSEKCARNVRIALQTAGADVSNHPIAAADWGRTLEKNGYKQIKPAFNRPQKGDIYIIDATSDHVYGHIAGYTGSEWISDFRQSGYAVYREKDVEYHYYRLEPATEL
ncbi:CHAP domain-containing protein [Acinetobacter brisouii]|jgi:surface antigen|uniref:CHAP domain-containing protein n=1 Tax=Acinetobacter brisouii TaxID=396323 RepID=UPI00124CE50F|nr:CHAP domain-containing protein [Acinetobacter brisouii]